MKKHVYNFLGGKSKQGIFVKRSMRRLAFGVMAMCLFSMVIVYIASAQKEEASYPNLKVTGYIQTSYMIDKDTLNNFQVKKARGKFAGKVSKSVGYALLFDFIDDKNGSNLADAYIDMALSRATLKIGQFKTPFSMEYLASSTKWDTIELAQVVNKLSTKRDIGIQVGGDVSQLLECAVGIFNGTGSNAPEQNKRKDINARGVIKPAKGLLMGVSHCEGWSGKEDENTTKRRTGAQLGFTKEPLSLKGEFILGKTNETTAYGWYAQVIYALPVFPGTSNQKVEAVAKYDYYDPDSDKEKDRADVATIGINCFITKNTKLQLNNRIIFDGDFGIDNNVVLAQLQVTW